MRRVVLPLILTLLFVEAVFALAGCGETAAEDSRDKLPDKLGDFSVSSAPLDTLLNAEYDLDALTAFFPTHDGYDQVVFSDYEAEPSLQIEDVDRAFPVEVLRKNRGCYYTVYKVKEGGYFYVLFFPVPSEQDPNTFVSGSVQYTRYLTEPLALSAFDGIRPGESTALDVKVIDPNLELCLVMSSGLYSYSFLAGNKILCITYDEAQSDAPLRNPGDLVVRSMEVVDDVEEGFHLGAILPQDLPWNMAG